MSFNHFQSFSTS